jgi:hypothetical protein
MLWLPVSALVKYPVLAADEGLDVFLKGLL